MVLVVFGSCLRIPVRFHWTAQSVAFFVVVVMVLAPDAYVWPSVLLLLVRSNFVLPGRVFVFVDIW